MHSNDACGDEVYSVTVLCAVHKTRRLQTRQLNQFGHKSEIENGNV